MEIKCTSHNVSLFEIFLPKVTKIGGNMTKFWQKEICTVFSVTRCSEPWKNSWTDWDAIYVEDSDGPREPRLGPDPHGKPQFWGGKRQPVIKYRDIQQSPVQKRLNRSLCRLDCISDWPKESWIRWGFRSQHEKRQFWRKKSPTVKYRDILPWAVQKWLNRLICLPFGLWTRVGRRKQNFTRIRQVLPMCPHGRSHWCHPANMTEPSICGSDVVLCQITLTTSWLCSYNQIT